MSKMDKARRMSAPSMLWLLREMVRAENGISTKKLWECVTEWDHKATAREFDLVLGQLLAEGFRCTNKMVYRIGAETPGRKARAPKEEDKRQLRMDW